MMLFRIATACILFSGLLVAGCNQPTAGPAEVTTATPPAAADTSTLLVKLQAADQLDGTEDHTITQCYVCGLGMAGKAEHAVEFEGYTVHLCSEACREHFAGEAAEVIRSTDIPAKPPASESAE